MNIKERKIELRRQAEARRASLSAEERAGKSALICDRLLERLDAWPGMTTGGQARRRPTLFTYMPIKTEVDVTPVMEACWERRIRVVVPRTYPEQKHLKLFEVRSYDDLERRRWGIREPKRHTAMLHDIRDVDVALVPGLAFDLNMGRLGYGGGFYDRFMQQFVRAGWGKPYIVAAAFDIQIIREVPMGMFDFRIDEIVTESRMISPSS